MCTRLQFSTVFHPWLDGQSERTIQTLEVMLRECVLDFGGSRDTYLPLAEFSCNNSFHAYIGMAPYEMSYGRRCRTPCLGKVGQRELGNAEVVQRATTALRDSGVNSEIRGWQLTLVYNLIEDQSHSFVLFDFRGKTRGCVCVFLRVWCKLKGRFDVLGEIDHRGSSVIAFLTQGVFRIGLLVPCLEGKTLSLLLMEVIEVMVVLFPSDLKRALYPQLLKLSKISGEKLSGHCLFSDWIQSVS
ncbi:hypothetical protein OSB04_019174 [Centaurea solstitialis]|uniref:Uncharacterized protein n=1 Tax=Centaurea solstitialis TaxID=347529 RepID=A0AA38T376_9ASTR|nr:hypothetical protein OSB04_019174 [Centaurea solstitialis]